MDDLFLLHLSGDDVSASVLVGELDAIGVSHRVVASLAGDTVSETPDRLIELLRQARFGAFIVTKRLPLIAWRELDLTALQLIIDRVVFVCDRVPVAALRRISPAYERFETIESQGEWNLVASHLASVLKADPASCFAKEHPRLRTLPVRSTVVTPSSALKHQEKPKVLSLPPNGQMRVFVSSTFRDMHAERDLLGRFVFPQLTDYCRVSTRKTSGEFDLGAALQCGIRIETAREPTTQSLLLSVPAMVR